MNNGRGTERHPQRRVERDLAGNTVLWWVVFVRRRERRLRLDGEGEKAGRELERGKESEKLYSFARSPPKNRRRSRLEPAGRLPSPLEDT
ncbi:hypothetical protein NL676_039820 [Syzygium grande]|nr:hypothetical protein NL676_039820 [Syzygium grande]